MFADSAHKDTFTRDNLPPLEQWPELVFSLPEIRYPERLNCATVLVENAVERQLGEQTAVIGDGFSWTYVELDNRASQFANLLTEKLGLIPGNRVLLRSPNNPMLAAAWLGVMKAGGVAVTTMAMLRSAELEKVARKAEISHALCDRRLAEEFQLAVERSGLMANCEFFDSGDAEGYLSGFSTDFVSVDTASDDVALLAFTSGTTGVPKATMHFHRDVLVMADIVGGRLLELTSSDTVVGSPPLGFTFGLGASLVFPLRFGGSVCLLETPSPGGVLQCIQENKVTGLFTAPAMYRAMLPVLDEYDISSLRFCVSAGEMLPRPTSDAWAHATGIRIVDGIGATELIHIFISATGDDIRPGATGKPLPGYEACVLDDANKPLPPGSTGRLAVKGPTGCRYLNDERQKEYVVDGWNVTGDVYAVDEDGYFWFQTRADDMILSSGYNIAGPEVESALLVHEAVSECAVIGVPDPDRGNIVKAFVVLSSGYEAAPDLAVELQDFVKQSIAPYKYPREVQFIDDLPKTLTGKIQRFALRD